MRKQRSDKGKKRAPYKRTQKQLETVRENFRRGMTEFWADEEKHKDLAERLNKIGEEHIIHKDITVREYENPTEYMRQYMIKYRKEHYEEFAKYQREWKRRQRRRQATRGRNG